MKFSYIWNFHCFQTISKFHIYEILTHVIESQLLGLQFSPRDTWGKFKWFTLGTLPAPACLANFYFLLPKRGWPTLFMRVTGPNSKDLIKKSSTGIQVLIGPDMDARGMFFATIKFAQKHSQIRRRRKVSERESQWNHRHVFQCWYWRYNVRNRRKTSTANSWSCRSLRRKSRCFTSG